MSGLNNVRCVYCKKLQQGLKDKERCNECEKEFKRIMSSIMSKYKGDTYKIAAR